MRKAFILILSLGLVAAACGDDAVPTTDPSASSAPTTEAGPTETTAPGTTAAAETTEATVPGPPAPEPGTLASLAKGKVEDPLMGSGWHRLDWGDDAHTVLESRRSTTGDAEFLDLLDIVAWDPPPAVNGLAADQVLVNAFIVFPSMEIGPSAIVVYTPGGEGFEATMVIDDASVETALLETTDYAAAAPDGPAALEFVPTTFDATASMVTGMVTVVDFDTFETAYEGEIQCDFSAEPLICVTLTDDGVLRPGDEGEEVEELQEDLTALGYLTGPVDGKYGPGTRAAVAAFQTDYWLTVDGKAGPQTSDLLADLAGGTSDLVLISQDGTSVVPFGTNSEDALATLVGALGTPDSTTGWYTDGCSAADEFKASWDGFTAILSDRNGTRQFDGWEVTDLGDLPANLRIANGIQGDSKWGDLDALGADFFDDYLGERWRIPALGYTNGRFVGPVGNPPAANEPIKSFGTGTGGYESC